MFPSYIEVKQDLEADIAQLVIARNKFQSEIKKILLIVGSIALVVGLIVIMIDSQQSQDLYWISLGIVVLIVLIVIVVKFDRLRRTFKQKFVSKMAQAVVSKCQFPNQTDAYVYHCQYEPEKHVSRSYMEQSQLFPYRIDKIQGEDLFSGKLGVTDFQFSEMKLIQTQTTTNSKGQTKRVDVTMFKGILFVADFHKSFDGMTTLHAENVLTNSFIGKMMVSPIRKVMRDLNVGETRLSIDLESEAFNEAFEILTTNEIEARYLLSSNMMERILAFRERHKQKIEISFVDSLICISMNTNKNYFELKMNGKDLEKELQHIYEDLLFFFGTIEAFDLNTRIWSK